MYYWLFVIKSNQSFARKNARRQANSYVRTFSSSISLMSLSIFLWFFSNCCSLPLYMCTGYREIRRKGWVVHMHGQVKIQGLASYHWGWLGGSLQVRAVRAEEENKLTFCALTQQFDACSSEQQMLSLSSPLAWVYPSRTIVRSLQMRKRGIPYIYNATYIII